MQPVMWFLSLLLLASGLLQLLRNEVVFGALLIVVGLVASPAIYGLLT